MLDAGTEVTMQVGGVAHHGVVQSYEPQYSFGTFPVRFHDGQWRLLSADEVAVAAASG